VNDRRFFLKNSFFAAAFSRFLPERFATYREKPAPGSRLMNGKVVLFQGDSITDGNRTRNTDWNHIMGHGYAYTIASKLWFEFPSKGFHFVNRGVSGNRITHLKQRWQTDTLDLKPDVLSFLVGINDVAGFIKGDEGFTAGQFEADYRALLRLTLEKLPNVRLVLCEPFILPVGPVKEDWEKYQNEVALRQEIVKRLASEFKAIHVPFQYAFDEALGKAPAEYWIWDGVHPMPAGHELMARLWLEKVKVILEI
jgi:lysophospholipase L1-like esterase